MTMIPGGSREAGEMLYGAIVGSLDILRVLPKDVRIVLHEPPLEN